MNENELIHYLDVNLKGRFVKFEEWKRRVNNKEFELIDLFYKIRNDGRKESVLKIRHKICGNIFLKQSNNLKAQKNCPICINKLSVSKLHAVMSILFKKYYSKAENEYDIGFRGLSGGISKYDIYVPNLNGKNTLIKFQSKYHDSNIELDKLKKEFAISKGYHFVAIDHRYVRIDEVVNEYFPRFEKVPNWALKEISQFNKTQIDILKIQNELNEYKTTIDIENQYGISRQIIRKYIQNGLLTQPKKDKSVIQLSLSGEFIECFRSTYEVSKKLNCRIRSALSNKTYYANGYFWVRKEDYKNGNYNIKENKHFLGVAS